MFRQNLRCFDPIMLPVIRAHQGRACHTGNDGPTVVREPIARRQILHYLCPKKWSFLWEHFRCYFSSIWLTILTWLINDNIYPKNGSLEHKYMKVQVAQMSQNWLDFLRKSQIVRRRSRVYSGSMIIVVTMYVERQGPKIGRFTSNLTRTQFLKTKLGKKFEILVLFLWIWWTKVEPAYR